VPDFEAWSQKTLGKLAHHPGTAETVKVVVWRAKNEHDAVERQWHGFRYICKQLEPEPEPKWGIPEEPPRRLRDVLQLWSYQSALPVRLPEGQLTGASRDIGEKAQRDAGFLSELTSGDLTRSGISEGPHRGKREGGFWREVQHLRALGLTKERSDFPFLAAAFRCISKMRRRLRGKENRVGSKRWGVALRVGIQGAPPDTKQPARCS